ncbi:PAS domain S-box protein [Dyella sp.]|jgi:diguanylate cyclase (GGDEF)-like protein/PAS domain S-box-containing protein|uniref:PAS domain S-box protein n=1 Tax=Dyella sp. TaxID=1869338 RepID=UPI002D792BB5|nr:PAS domain S-box protein [Dyella sp.]HET6433076.1 PAS domain S-box protein [Dyella sp.]
MLEPPPLADEAERLQLLRSLGLLDGAPVPLLDRITRLATRLFDLPVALITLVDAQRQWFLSRVGMPLQETPRSQSLCGHAITQPGAWVIADTHQDPRFADNPLVTGAPYIRFYAGRPLRSRHGLPLGTLCVIDHRPRQFDAHDLATLDDLAAMVESHLHALEQSVEARAAKASLARSEQLFARTMSHAAAGVAITTPAGCWVEVNQRFCEIVGHPRERLIGQRAAAIVHAQDLERARTMVRRVLQGEAEALDLELSFVRADGTLRWVQVGASALPDAGGRPQNLVTVLTDIHARREAQTALQALQLSLEQRVEARTRELHEVVARLQTEMATRAAAQRALDEQKERFQATLRDASDAFIEVDHHGRIVAWNRSAERTFGWSAAEVMGRTLDETVMPAALRARYRAAWEALLRGDGGAWSGQRQELTGLRRDGSEFPLEASFGSSHSGGKPLMNAFVRDISQRKADEQALRESAARLKTITDNAPAMIAFIDRELRYRFHNRAYTDWFGVAPDGLVGTHARDFWGPAAYQHLRPSLAAVLAGTPVRVEYRLEALNGPMWFYASLVPHVEEHGDITGFYLIAQDITERRQLYQRIEHEATHDVLTGLPNRRALMQRLDEAMARVRRHQRAMAVLFMDLDGFKQMNDTLGHEFGDAVLQHFATAVHAAVRETDFVARLAGDEFAVVLEDLAGEESQAGEVATALLERLRVDQEIQGVAVTLSTSIGVAMHAGDDEETAQELLHRADVAMYRAKAAGKRRLSF